MLRVYIRIIAALFAVAVLAVAAVGGWWVYRQSYVPEQQAVREIRELMKSTAPKADPGKKRFDQAMELIRLREFDAARQILTEILEVYRDSERVPDARRVLGEMNLDRLFSRTPMPGKLEYTVARRGDSLHEIARKFHTTIAYIKRVNNLFSNVIHPDDRLIVYPLDFSMEVDLANRRLTLLKDGRFFKEYNLAGHHLPFSSLPENTQIGDKPAWLDGRKVAPTDERYPAAVKWLQTVRRGNSAGVYFCPPPKALPEGSDAKPVPGIYLDEGDLEELSTIVRSGTPVRFLKNAGGTTANPATPQRPVSVYHESRTAGV